MNEAQLNCQCIGYRDKGEALCVKCKMRILEGKPQFEDNYNRPVTCPVDPAEAMQCDSCQ